MMEDDWAECPEGRGECGCNSPHETQLNPVQENRAYMCSGVQACSHYNVKFLIIYFFKM